MPLAHHSIFSMYGFWLPNDPRGSGSDYIAVWELYRYGTATKTSSRQSVAAVEHDRAARFAAKRSLRYPPVEIDGVQAVAIVGGFGDACSEGDYQVHACAVLPDHVHLVLGVHQRDGRVMVGHLKSRATRALKAAGLWPADRRSIWGAHGWNVYLDAVADVERAIRYVEENPIKEGKRVQRWSLVTPFDLRVAGQKASLPHAPKRRVGGAALRSQQEKARRKRRG
jgi:REP element-mobilizing transposase RayT